MLFGFMARPTVWYPWEPNLARESPWLALFSQRKSVPPSHGETAARAADASAEVLCYGRTLGKIAKFARLQRKYSVLCYQFPKLATMGGVHRTLCDRLWPGSHMHSGQCRNVKNLALRVEPAAIPTRPTLRDGH